MGTMENASASALVLTLKTVTKLLVSERCHAIASEGNGAGVGSQVCSHQDNKKGIVFRYKQIVYQLRVRGCLVSCVGPRTHPHNGSV